MTDPGVFLSKSKYLAGLQCPKLLWFHYNAKDEIPPVDEAKQALFDQGHEVGEWAKKVFPSGIDVRWDQGFKLVIKQSKELLSERKPLFEAGFKYRNAYSRIDILKPVGEDEWDIIEVKSGTSVKDINVHDVSFQKYCCEGAGLKIRNCFLMHIDSSYVRDGDIDPESLFSTEDISEDVAGLTLDVETNIDSMIDVIKGPKLNIRIGPQCKDPYDCALIEKCWDFLPENNVFELYRMGKKGFDLLEQGVENIKDLPEGYRLNTKQEIQKEAIDNETTHVNHRQLKSFLGSLEYPIHYFDFETINPAVPLYDGTRPYQQVPFQFSLDIESEDGTVEHFEYLHKGTGDPRPELLKEMKKAFKKEGSIVVYYQSFERGRLLELASAFPDYEDFIQGLLSRFKDLIEPFSGFDYYNPSQKGSASLKAVMPALTGKGYEDLSISDGGQASRQYIRLISTELPPSEKEQIRKDLLEYCGQDTEGMIWMVHELKRLVENG